jgi:hypothetical protein
LPDTGLGFGHLSRIRAISFYFNARLFEHRFKAPAHRASTACRRRTPKPRGSTIILRVIGVARPHNDPRSSVRARTRTRVCASTIEPGDSDNEIRRVENDARSRGPLCIRCSRECARMSQRRIAVSRRCVSCTRADEQRNVTYRNSGQFRKPRHGNVSEHGRGAFRKGRNDEGSLIMRSCPLARPSSVPISRFLSRPRRLRRVWVFLRGVTATPHPSLARSELSHMADPSRQLLSIPPLGPDTSRLTSRRACFTESRSFFARFPFRSRFHSWESTYLFIRLPCLVYLVLPSCARARARARADFENPLPIRSLDIFA